MGLIYDRVEKRNRTVYAFIATLSHSRFTFVELTYSQDQKSFVGSNVRMVEFFGGVPRRVVALPHQLSYRSRGVASSPILPAAVP